MRKKHGMPAKDETLEDQFEDLYSSENIDDKLLADDEPVVDQDEASESRLDSENDSDSSDSSDEDSDDDDSEDDCYDEDSADDDEAEDEDADEENSNEVYDVDDGTGSARTKSTFKLSISGGNRGWLLKLKSSYSC